MRAGGGASPCGSTTTGRYTPVERTVAGGRSGCRSSRRSRIRPASPPGSPRDCSRTRGSAGRGSDHGDLHLAVVADRPARPPSKPNPTARQPRPVDVRARQLLRSTARDRTAPPPAASGRPTAGPQPAHTTASCGAPQPAFSPLDPRGDHHRILGPRTPAQRRPRPLVEQLQPHLGRAQRAAPTRVAHPDPFPRRRTVCASRSGPRIRRSPAASGPRRPRRPGPPTAAGGVPCPSSAPTWQAANPLTDRRVRPHRFGRLPAPARDASRHPEPRRLSRPVVLGPLG